MTVRATPAGKSSLVTIALGLEPIQAARPLSHISVSVIPALFSFHSLGYIGPPQHMHRTLRNTGKVPLCLQHTADACSARPLTDEDRVVLRSDRRAGATARGAGT